MKTVILKEDEFIATEIIATERNKAQVMKKLAAKIIAKGNKYRLLALLDWERFALYGNPDLWTRIAILEPTFSK